MNWISRQKLYQPKPCHSKLLSHASNPLAISMGGDLYRVFYNSRDSENRSSVGAVDLNILTGEVVQEFDEPFFVYGKMSSFYSNGISLGNIYEKDGSKYMLFMGWKNTEGQHWYGEIGRLIVTDNFTVELDTDKPIVTLDAEDPISLSYPWVMQHNGIYKMWYGSTESWSSDNGEMVHVIKYAESHNGDDWVKKGVAVPFEIGRAQAFSRPSVYQNSSGSLTMWYSFRSGNGDGYRIGVSHSSDGETWSFPVQESSLNPANAGWDSEMVEYPFVFRHLDKLYMLYNGNGYGASGFGVAAGNGV